MIEQWATQPRLRAATMGALQLVLVASAFMLWLDSRTYDRAGHELALGRAALLVAFVYGWVIALDAAGALNAPVALTSMLIATAAQAVLLLFVFLTDVGSINPYLADGVDRYAAAPGLYAGAATVALSLVLALAGLRGRVSRPAT